MFFDVEKIAAIAAHRRRVIFGVLMHVKNSRVKHGT